MVQCGALQLLGTSLLSKTEGVTVVLSEEVPEMEYESGRLIGKGEARTVGGGIISLALSLDMHT